MNAAIVLTIILGCGIWIIWNTSRKAAKNSVNLQYAKKCIKRQSLIYKVLYKYINLTGDELSMRVRENREAAQRRMRDTNRLDR